MEVILNPNVYYLNIILRTFARYISNPTTWKHVVGFMPMLKVWLRANWTTENGYWGPSIIDTSTTSSLSESAFPNSGTRWRFQQYHPFSEIKQHHPFLQKSEEVKFFTDQVRRVLGSGGCLLFVTMLNNLKTDLF